MSDSYVNRRGRCLCGWPMPDVFLTDATTVLAANAAGSEDCDESPFRLMVHCPACGYRVRYRLGVIADPTDDLKDHCLLGPQDAKATVAPLALSDDKARTLRVQFDALLDAGIQGTVDKRDVATAGMAMAVAFLHSAGVTDEAEVVARLQTVIAQVRVLRDDPPAPTPGAPS